MCSSDLSDIYSIGAIAFYKLFGRKPNVLDGSIGCSYDFALLRTKDQRYQPDFFRLLDEFLHKSIATAVAFRYQSIEELIPVLERLAALSQVEDVFFVPSVYISFWMFYRTKTGIDRNR